MEMNRQQPTIDPNHENSQMTKEQWLAVCKEAALKIDPETAEVRWDYARTLDPYGIGDAPDEYFQVGRACFARSPGSDVWFGLATCPTQPELPCGKSTSHAWRSLRDLFRLSYSPKRLMSYSPKMRLHRPTSKG